MFERVAALYEEEGDTLKLRATEWLAKYSPYHYGVKRHVSNPSLADSLRIGVALDSVFRHRLDSAGCRMVEEEAVMDDDVLTEDFIRENIDLAFDSWVKPWAKDVSFDDFCKYILPYRNDDEALEGWRRYFKEKYEHTIIDSVSDPTSIREVAGYLIRQLRREVEYGPKMGRFNHQLVSVADMQRLHWMECRGCAHYVTLAMRACGVPCMMITNHWRFTEVPHSTVVFPCVGNNKQAFRLTIGDSLMEMGTPKDTMAVWACWGRSYETNPDLTSLLDDYKDGGRKQEALHRFALPVCREDVTPQMSTAYDFSLPVPDSLRSRHHLFLCRFADWKWYPVRVGKVMGDSVSFKNATIRQWYRLGYADADSVRTFGGTFTLVGDSGVARKDQRDIVRPYDLSGDTVLFKLAFSCKADERRLTRRITTHYWGGEEGWKPCTQEAPLWGFNEKTAEYKVFDETMHGTFKPVFHLFQVRLPRWTVFADDAFGRPLGFICADKETGEGYFMEF